MSAERRIKYYGVKDHSTYFDRKLVAHLLKEHKANNCNYDLNDILELGNALKFIDNKIFPEGTSNKDLGVF